MANEDVADFINSGAGANLPGFKFNNVGDKIVGTVLRTSVRETKKMGNPNEKEKQLVIELKTDQVYTQMGTDRQTGQPVTLTGDEWTVWVKSPSQMLTKLADALRAGNAAKGAPFPGDRLAVEFVGTEASKTAGFAPKKLYEVAYKPGAAAAPAAVSVDDL